MGPESGFCQTMGSTTRVAVPATAPNSRVGLPVRRLGTDEFSQRWKTSWMIREIKIAVTDRKIAANRPIMPVSNGQVGIAAIRLSVIS